MSNKEPKQELKVGGKISPTTSKKHFHPLSAFHQALIALQRPENFAFYLRILTFYRYLSSILIKKY